MPRFARKPEQYKHLWKEGSLVTIAESLDEEPRPCFTDKQ